ncbi:Maf-like protein [Trichomonas vaginalis G3]|uniref:Maf-like protein n=1 Tax=Trichomonas vaginalis (strain ATCC PRA-98 / G3) TaxID=412133 RepID=A2G104_TRIV3|nr:maF-like protein family [Trichomonas vaginalis G3]EAX89162.1 Maf-like protein [Trichomonas vaginalis G3]KAI5493690.1 maF-like protein family [Trichomonas vaginalis G3]|eukprot:XP_001302092.1 Maf-like protein [Trichomonas vaginalis G3]
MRIILGSTSKWRHEIATRALNMTIEMMEANIDEKAAAREAHPKDPAEHVSAIAKGKLDKIFSMVTGDPAIVMCYDTVVVYDNQILEKPVDHDDLVRMVKLWAAKDRVTSVYTALAIGRTDTGERINEVHVSHVIMTRDLTPEEFDKYINGKYTKYSSGALITEDILEISACKLDGNLDTIQGLPVEATIKAVNLLQSQ